MRVRSRALVSGMALVAGIMATVTPGARAAEIVPAKPPQLPSIVEQTLARVSQAAALRQAVDPRSLSNDVVHVDAEGRIELTFHSTRATGKAEEADLRSLGGVELVTVPQFGMVQAFVPAGKVAAPPPSRGWPRSPPLATGRWTSDR